MSNIQKQHKISPAIAWLTIQKFIIFYCPLDREHTKSPGLFSCQWYDNQKPHPQQLSNRIQIRASQPQPFPLLKKPLPPPHPQPSLLFHPPQNNRIRMIHMQLHPPEVVVCVHPPQFVAAKSLIGDTSKIIYSVSYAS